MTNSNDLPKLDFNKLNYGQFTVRFWAITYMLLYISFGIVDYLSSPLNFQNLWIIRLTVLPFFFTVILTTHIKFLANYRPLFNSIMVFIAPFSIILMIAIAKPEEYAKSVYFAGIVLSAFPIGFITMSVKRTFRIVYLLLICYFGILGWDKGIPGDHFIVISVFVVASMIGTILCAYLLESNQNKIIDQTIQLDGLVKLKNQFISILAHDLRAPCGNIVGFTNLYLSEPETFKESGIKTVIEGIKKSATGLFNLLQNLLEWSKVQNATQEVNFSMIRFEHLIKRNVELLSGMMEIKRIQLIYELADSDVMVYGDSEMISTVVRNLLSNSIKFTPEEGTIEISCKSGNSHLFVSISDNGVGIPEEKLKTIFQIEKNKSTFGTNKEVGSGLGLLLCHDLIKKNNGDIWVKSVKGKGSKFSISIPLYFPNAQVV